MAFQGDSIYWVEVEKVVPNPFQPRRVFDQSKLQELAESIRMYGVLQPLTVTRHEVQRDDGTFYTEYELIAGERRLRASRLCGVAQVPVIIREGEQNEQEKLELAIIENLQREDLNAVDRAIAFKQLSEQFSLSHSQVAKKMGRSREYVSNSIRLLGLPKHILESLGEGKMMEGHARTLLMLTDRPEEQEVVYREILLKKLSVREVERIVRKIATDKVRKKKLTEADLSLIEFEKRFTETLGTRVQILKTDFGGKLTIDYFSEDDLEIIFKRIHEEAADAAKIEKDIAKTITDSTALSITVEDNPVTSVPVKAPNVPLMVTPSPQLPQAQSVSEDLINATPVVEAVDNQSVPPNVEIDKVIPSFSPLLPQTESIPQTLIEEPVEEEGEHAVKPIDYEISSEQNDIFAGGSDPVLSPINSPTQEYASNLNSENISPLPKPVLLDTLVPQVVEKVLDLVPQENVSSEQNVSADSVPLLQPQPLVQKTPVVYADVEKKKEVLSDHLENNQQNTSQQESVSEISKNYSVPEPAVIEQDKINVDKVETKSSAEDDSNEDLYSISNFSI